MVERVNISEPPKDLEPIYQQIWELALPYQDKRDDIGHAATVTNFARILLEKVSGADPRVVIPAAILHDIGWSQLSEEERMGSVDGTLSKEESGRVRHAHQREGVALAKQILMQVGYDPQLTNHICAIISQHDTRKGTISIEDSTVRDADKLWRFTQPGVDADFRRGQFSMVDQWMEKRGAEIKQKGYFFTGHAKEMAIIEFIRRRLEFFDLDE